MWRRSPIRVGDARPVVPRWGLGITDVGVGPLIMVGDDGCWRRSPIGVVDDGCGLGPRSGSWMTDVGGRLSIVAPAKERHPVPRYGAQGRGVDTASTRDIAEHLRSSVHPLWAPGMGFGGGGDSTERPCRLRAPTVTLNEVEGSKVAGSRALLPIGCRFFDFAQNDMYLRSE